MRPRAVSICALLAWCLSAADATPGWRDEDLFVRPQDQHALLFGSLDVGRSVFASVGAKQTLTGPLDETGFVAVETTGFGLNVERFRRDGVDRPAMRVTGQQSVMLGHQWNEGIFLTAVAGPEVTQEQVTIAGRVYRLSEARLGIRGQAELWARPTPDTMLAATLVGSSSLGSLWTRAAAGARIPGGAFLGPEVTVYVTSTYQEVRVGAHLTGARMGRIETRVSAGWMSADDGRRGGGYLGLTAWMRL